MVIEITGPEQFTKDELWTIWGMTTDWGFEYSLNADEDKVKALRVKVAEMLDKLNGGCSEKQDTAD